MGELLKTIIIAVGVALLTLILERGYKRLHQKRSKK